MQGRHRAALAGALILLATLAGAEVRPIPAAAERVLPPAPPRALPGEPAPAFVSLRGTPPHPVALAAPPDAASPGPGHFFGPLGLPCAARLEATSAPGGTVRLRVEAPCEAHGAVVLTHGPLAASYRLSSSGAVEATFPAFADRAAYTARLAGGATLSAEVEVPGAAGYERVVAMWQGPQPVAVHAYEYGAAAGEAGHVWSGAAQAAAVAEAGRGGFLIDLGSPAAGADWRGAEVYSFPAADARRPGSVRIAFGAPVTAATCGRALRATTLQIGAGLPGAPVDIAWTMPDCDSAAPAGDLMLKNLARDLKIAPQ